MIDHDAPNAELRLGEKFRAAMGPQLLAVLEDPTVCDVMVNPDGAVFVERIGEHMVLAPFSVPEAKRADMVKTAVRLGGGSHRDGASILETRIPGYGWRFEGVLPPVTAAPALSIRKPPTRVFQLAEYVAKGAMTRQAFEALVSSVTSHKNVLVVGGTGTGKTTLVNALLGEIAERCPSERVAVLEDTPEIQCVCPNRVQMVTTRHESLYDLLRACLRMRPDRIVIGEVRGPEVRQLLNAWNTGHSGGVCTVHANGALEGLRRFEQLWIQQGGDIAVARQEIANNVHVLVSIERHAGRRVVRQVVEVEGLNEQGGYKWKQIA